MLSNSFFILAGKVTLSDLNSKVQLGDNLLVELQKGLDTYMPNLWSGVLTLMKNVMQPYGTAILLVLFFVEFINISKRITDSGGAMTFEAFVPVLIKYIFVAAFTANTHLVLQFIGQVSADIVTKIGSTGTASYEQMEAIKGKGLWGSMIVAILSFIAGFVRMGAKFFLQIQVWMRFMTLYIMVPFSPLAFATLVSDEWRSIGINYIKSFIAYAVQGIVIALVIAYMPMIFKQLATWNNADSQQGISYFMSAIFQSIGMILIFQKSREVARNIVGA